jgi:adenylate kinase
MSKVFHVVYLTGAPSTGKSTLAGRLHEILTPLAKWDYGEELRRLVSRKLRREVTYAELRSDSAALAAVRQVQSLDAQLLLWVGRTRRRSHVVIDSHAVTKEGFGFRTTPFSLREVQRLRPTVIIALYADPSHVRARHRIDRQGRRMVTSFEAGLHTALQGSVAISYGIMTGTPVHFVDTASGIEGTLRHVRHLLTSRVV